MEKQNPHLPDELNDPKLPVIHSSVPGNGMQQRRSDMPLPQGSTAAKESL